MSLPFFAATLPTLFPDAPPPLAEARFLELAREHLAPDCVRALEALAADRPSGHRFVRAWLWHETQLRNAVARHRASRLGLDPGPWTHPHEGYDVALERGVAAAFQESDPLRREKALDALRWRRAGELGGFDPLAPSAILAYFLRLRLAARAAARDAVQGRRRLDAVSAPPSATSFAAVPAP